MLTVVLGASTNPRRYSYMAGNELVANGYKILPVGIKTGKLADVEIRRDYPLDIRIDTIAMYLSEKNQEQYYDLILKNPPSRVIFNPGTYNSYLEERLQSIGVETMKSCVLIMLSRGAY